MEEEKKKAVSGEEIVKLGSFKTRIKRAGMIQQLTLTVMWEKTNTGEYPYLFLDKIVPVGELAKIAQKLSLPVKAKNAFAFPVGKSSKDFMGYSKWKK